MNDTWHFLREFESKDLVKRFYKQRNNLELNSTKALEITSAFIQGREYFDSYSKADISVQPLLLYYGIVSLTRGLILCIDPKARENNIIPAHGLSLKNVPETFETKRYQDLELETSNGTFKELIKATNNKSYFRCASNGINAFISYDIPERDFKFRLLDIAYNLPDLKISVESWLGEKIPTSLINSWLKLENGKCISHLLGNYDKKFCEKIFDKKIFGELTVQTSGSETIVEHSDKIFPQTAQMWISTFGTMGDPFVTPALESKIFLNNISYMFASSYVFGMISRYYPSIWNNINKGIMNDSIFPFAINLMSFLESKYPQIILDYLKAPYSFELTE
jgi:hypothetical protein